MTIFQNSEKNKTIRALRYPSVPGCCCKNSYSLTDAPGEGCGAKMANASLEVAQEKIYTRGCIPALQDLTMRNADIFSGIILGLFTVTLAAIVTSCLLKNKKKVDLLRNNNRLRKWEGCRSKSRWERSSFGFLCVLKIYLNALSDKLKSWIPPTTIILEWNISTKMHLQPKKSREKHSRY